MEFEKKRENEKPGKIRLMINSHFKVNARARSLVYFLYDLRCCCWIWLMQHIDWTLNKILQTKRNCIWLTKSNKKNIFYIVLGIKVGCLPQSLYVSLFLIIIYYKINCVHIKCWHSGQSVLYIIYFHQTNTYRCEWHTHTHRHMSLYFEIIGIHVIIPSTLSFSLPPWNQIQ